MSEGAAPNRWKHRGSGGGALRAGQFFRIFNKNYLLLGIFGLKFLLQNIF